MTRSNRLDGVTLSPTIAMVAKAREMRAAGKDIISMSAGEPDHDTPNYIKDGAIEAIRNGFTKYTPTYGIVDLRKVIVDKFKRDNELEYSVDQIMVCSGAKHILFNICMAMLNPMDEVIVCLPYWVSYKDIVTITGGVTRLVDCSDTGLKITPELLEAAINDRTRLFILNSPNNPSGVMYSYDEIRALADVLLRHENVYIISDDIYEHIIYEKKFYTIAQVEPKLYARTLTVNGVSKAYSMTGWRIGYVGGSADVIKAMGIIQSQSTSHPSSISQYAALVALSGPQDCLEVYRQKFLERRGLVVSKLRDIKYLDFVIPDGAFYIFVSCVELFKVQNKIQNDIKFTQYLLEEYGIATIPGSAFGMKDYIRVSYATNIELLSKGLDLLKAAVENLLV